MYAISATSKTDFRLVKLVLSCWLQHVPELGAISLNCHKANDI